MAKNDKKSGITTVVVADRHTVFFDDKNYAPNETLDLPVDEAERLKKIGFVLDVETITSDSNAFGDGINIQTTDGTSIQAL